MPGPFPQYAPFAVGPPHPGQTSCAHLRHRLGSPPALGWNTTPHWHFRPVVGGRTEAAPLMRAARTRSTARWSPAWIDHQAKPERTPRFRRQRRRAMRTSRSRNVSGWARTATPGMRTIFTMTPLPSPPGEPGGLCGLRGLSRTPRPLPSPTTRPWRSGTRRRGRCSSRPSGARSST